ncbi:MAG TPA: ABC transporter permease [Verrucomicrobiae bacterium]|nr:ABC transporter permease [Verrucomicrobiae bacterium]
MNDLRFALRLLRKDPGFAAVAVLTLALGIGANTAIFSFVYTILLKPLPYPNPERLVQLFESNVGNGWHKNAIGAPVIAEWRKQATVFEGIAAQGSGSYSLTGRGMPAVLTGARISANTFTLLGAKPLQGRDFVQEEETYGRHHVVLLAYECWRKRFGGDPNILGQSLTLDGEPYQVVGVMPPRMQYPNPNVEIWTPLAFNPSQLSQRHNHSYSAFARLKPGVTISAARAQMDLISSQLAAADEQNKGWGIEVYPMLENQVGDSRRLLLVLLGAVGFVLLICCANIANLLLARAAARGREFAVRAALGAARGHIIRQLLVESLVLASLGGVAGVMVARMGVGVLLSASPPDLPRISEGIRLDGWTLLFTAAVTLATGLLFGLAPAWQTARQSMVRDMNEAARGSSSGPHGRRLGSLFVVTQVALAMMLVISAGLMVRSFGRLLSQDLGYQRENLINMTLNLPAKTYPGLGAKTVLLEQLRERVSTIPGVTSAALAYGLPLGFEDSQLSVEIVGAPPPPPGESVSAGYAQVSPGYFRTLGIPLLQGRDFTSQDGTNSSPVLIVDQTFARNFKLGANPVGRFVNVGDGAQKAEIVGMVKDVKRRDLASAPRGEMYRPYLQNCWGYMNLIVRTRRSPEDITRAVRFELDQLDKDLPIQEVRTVTQLLDSALQQRRLSVELVSGFGGLALLLTAIGLYGVLAYNVGQRSREIGIRMALGAQKSQVLSLVIAHGIRLTLVGIGFGVITALALTRVIGSLLYEVKSSDPMTYLVVSFLLLVVGLFACWLPARRATRVDPIQSLRYE